MLAQSSPLPLIIDYLDKDPVTAEDEEGVVLALQHRNRVRRIRIQMPASNLQRLIRAIDGEFPMLEYLYFTRPSEYSTSLILPETFQAPRLRHLLMMGIVFPIGSPLLMTHVGLVTLSLQNTHLYFSPNDLLERLLLMPHLETLLVYIHFPVDRRFLPAPITTTITLPNLRWFGFGGAIAYLEPLIPWITAPRLEKFQILHLNPLEFRASCFLQFMNAAENLRFGSAKFRFYDGEAVVWVYPRKGARMYSFYMHLGGQYLRQQVPSSARIFCALRTAFSAVEHLDLDAEAGPSPWYSHSHWRDLLGSFGSLKSLLVGHRLVGDISRSFQLDEGESPTEFLPELKELSYSATSNAGDAFIAFADARRIARCPITLSRH